MSDVAMERMLAKREVMSIVGLARTTLDRRIAAGEFPCAVQIAPQRIAWRLSEVRAWMDSRPRVVPKRARKQENTDAV